MGENVSNCKRVQTGVPRRPLLEESDHRRWQNRPSQRKLLLFSAAVATEKPPDLLLPWQQWREREGERGPSISQSEFALLPVLHKEQTAEWETCRALLGLGSYRRCESTLPPAGPTWQTAVQRWTSFFPSGANHKQSGRLCARSVSQSHQRPSVLLWDWNPHPSCDWTSCSTC